MAPAAAFMQNSVLQQGSCRQANQMCLQQDVARTNLVARLSSSQSSFCGSSIGIQKGSFKACKDARSLVVYAVKNGATLDRPLRVAVVGGGPAGSCTAETLAKGGIETYLFERKMDNCKVSTS